MDTSSNEETFKCSLLSLKQNSYTNLIHQVYNLTHPSNLPWPGYSAQHKIEDDIVEDGELDDKDEDLQTTNNNHRRFQTSLEDQFKIDASAERLAWLQCLLVFMESRGTPISSSPTVPGSVGVALDLHKLYHCTRDQGGMERCCDNQSWRNVAVRMEIPGQKAGILKKIYSQYLLPYEEHLRSQNNNIRESSLGSMLSGGARPFPRPVPRLPKPVPALNNKMKFKKKTKGKRINMMKNNVFSRLG